MEEEGKIKLEYISPELYVSESVAVVGSSKILLNNEWGEEIDSHDDVIRFNRAPTDGFEKYVGSKTTIRVANNHVFRNIPVDDDVRFRDIKDKYPTNFIKNQKNTKIINVGGRNNEGWAQRHGNIHETSEAFLIDFNSLNKGKDKLYTAGFYLVTILMESGIVPDLYGFGIPEGEDSSHYWVERDKRSFCHDYNNERNQLKAWEKEGKVNLFL